MDIGIILALSASVISVLTGGILSKRIIREFVLKGLVRELPPKTYAERLSDLAGSLTKASGEVDAVLGEMDQVAKEREQSIRDLGSGLAELEKRENELKERIDALQSVPIPVAEQFAKLVKSGEKRSAKRDYALFISGVVVTTIIAVVLQLVFGK